MSRRSGLASSRRDRRARTAVAALFFVNGALFANWVPRIPAVKSGLGLSDTMLGLALLGVGLGALFGSLAAGSLVARFGSRSVAVVGGLALAASLALPGLTGSAWTLGVALAVIGLTDAVMDVAMNAHGLRVQERYGRSIINGLHALWSVGAVAGSLTGSLAAGLATPVAVHLGLVGLILGLVLLASRPQLLSTAEDREPARGARLVRRADFAAPTGLIGVLGTLTLLGSVVEDVPQSWSAVYMQESLGAAPGVAGLAYAAFAAAMTVGRLVGDRVVDRAGPVATVRGGALLAAAGLGVGLALAEPVAAIAGFAAAGLGASTLFPLTFAAAARVPGVLPGAAIGMVSLLARVGFLVAPPIVGVIADAAGLGAALGLVVVAALAIAGLARALAPRDSRYRTVTPSDR